MLRVFLKIHQGILLEDVLPEVCKDLLCPEKSEKMLVFKGECMIEVVAIGSASSGDKGNRKLTR